MLYLLLHVYQCPYPHARKRSTWKITFLSSSLANEPEELRAYTETSNVHTNTCDKKKSFKQMTNLYVTDPAMGSNTILGTSAK